MIQIKWGFLSFCVRYVSWYLATRPQRQRWVSGTGIMICSEHFTDCSNFWVSQAAGIKTLHADHQTPLLSVLLFTELFTCDVEAESPVRTIIDNNIFPQKTQKHDQSFPELDLMDQKSPRLILTWLIAALHWWCHGLKTVHAGSLTRLTGTQQSSRDIINVSSFTWTLPGWTTVLKNKPADWSSVSVQVNDTEIKPGTCESVLQPSRCQIRTVD